MDAALRRIGSVNIQSMPGESAFIKPYSIQYEMDGKKRRWDAVQSHGSVGALVYQRSQDSVVIVRQFRPAVYAWAKLEAEKSGQPPPPIASAFTYEICAGLIDKDKSLEEITAEEIQEETGFSVEAASLQLVTTYNSSVGTSGSVHHMFTVDVDDSTPHDGGGGLEDSGEAIELLLLPLGSALEFASDTTLNKSAGLLFGIMYLYNREKTTQK